MTSSSNAENLFNDCIYLHEKNSDGINEKIIKIKEEFVKFYLKQDRYDVRNQYKQLFRTFHVLIIPIIF